MAPAAGAEEVLNAFNLSEAEPRAEPEDAGAQDLERMGRVVAAEHALLLEHVRFVEGIEQVGAEGHSDAAEGELLFDPQVDDVDVRITEGVRRGVDRDVDAAAGVVA